MSEKNPFWLYVLAFLMVFMGLMGILGGVLLVIRPDGGLMNIPVTDLAPTPFANFLVPGFVLLVLIGILPLFLTYALFARPNWTIFKNLNLYKDMAWPWTWAVYYGLLLVVWIMIEISWIGYHTIVQSVVGLWGVIIVALALSLKIRNYCSFPMYSNSRE